MTHPDRYADHIGHLQSAYADTLELLRAENVLIDGVLLHSLEVGQCIIQVEYGNFDHDQL